MQARSGALESQVAILSSASQALQARVSGLENQLVQSAFRFHTLQTQVRHKLLKSEVNPSNIRSSETVQSPDM